MMLFWDLVVLKQCCDSQRESQSIEEVVLEAVVLGLC